MKLCKNKISDVVAKFEDGTTYTIPHEVIHTVIISKLFFDNFLPILIIKALVPYEQALKINSSQASYFVEFNKFFVDELQQSFDVNTVAYKGFLKGEFTNMNVRDNSLSTIEPVSDKSKYGISDKKGVEEYSYPIELCLFNKQDLDYQSMNNFSPSNCTITDAVMGVICGTNQGPTLLQQPDNNETYSYMKIPQDNTFIGMMESLQKMYGIYSHGLVTFNDFDVLYVCDKEPACKCWRLGEYKRIYVNVLDKTQDKASMYGIEEIEKDNSYSIYSLRAPSISDGTVVSKQVNTSDKTLVDVYNRGKTSIGNLNNTNVINAKNNSEIYVEACNYEEALLKNCISINFSEIDTEQLTPNKEFIFKFKIDNGKYSNYDGSYKLKSFVAIYTKGTDDTFVNNIQADFIKA